MLREGKKKALSEILGTGVGVILAKKVSKKKVTLDPIGFVSINESQNFAHVASSGKSLGFSKEDFIGITEFSSKYEGVQVDYIIKRVKDETNIKKRVILNSQLFNSSQFEEYLDK